MPIDRAVSDSYRLFREKHPWMPARTALQWAKTPAAANDGWKPVISHDYGGHALWAKVIDGFRVELRATVESHGPKDGDYGSYDDGYENNVGYWTLHDPPLGLPSRHFTTPRVDASNYSRDGSNFFVIDHLEEQYQSWRERGQSKSVARDLVTTMAQEEGRELYEKLDYFNIDVHVFLGETEFAHDRTTTSMLAPGDDEILGTALDTSVVEDAVETAKERLAEIRAGLPPNMGVKNALDIELLANASQILAELNTRYGDSDEAGGAVERMCDAFDELKEMLT